MNHKGYHPYRGKQRGHRLRNLILALLLIAVAAFGVLEGIIASQGQDNIQGEPQIMVVFGCQVKQWGPSILLQDRLDTALLYLEDHPDMTVVVTGGQGDDEPISEAQCMYDYLTAHGVKEERILREDRSVNTWQNVNYSLQLLAENGYDITDDVILVSNGFHLARIQMLWGRAGGGDRLSTLAAPASHRPSAVYMFFREPLALVKSFLLDR